MPFDEGKREEEDMMLLSDAEIREVRKLSRYRTDPLVIALGRRMDRVRLQAAFEACAAAG